ncbi:nucleolar protein 12 isoform 10 [Mus musculus]|nr:nucleolar protein 12 isoform 10 [Mus musculus]
MLAEREEALARGPGWVPGRGDVIPGKANKSLAQEVQRSPALSAHLLPHSYTARTQSEEGQEETPSAGTGLHQETSKCHTYQQDPAPPSDDWKSQAQRGVSPQTWGSQLESLAVPVTQLHRGLPAA